MDRATKGCADLVTRDWRFGTLNHSVDLDLLVVVGWIVFAKWR
jgi:hypothetical protein